VITFSKEQIDRWLTAQNMIQGEPKSLVQQAKKCILHHLHPGVAQWGSFRKKTSPGPVDILFIHTYESEPRRLQKLLDLLDRAQLKRAHYQLPFLSQAFKRGLLLPHPFHLPLSLGAWASHAQHIVSQFKPKVCITLENSLLEAPFIKALMGLTGGTYVNISHAVTPQNPGHCVTDYHYYFLFGESSLRNLVANPYRTASTKGVFTGSPFIDFKEEVFSGDPRTKLALYLPSNLQGRSPDHETFANLMLVKEWVEANPGFRLRIKKHPLDESPLWQKHFAHLGNVEILPNMISFQEALESVPLVISHWSNAAIESAVMGRPSVVVNSSQLNANYLHFSDFFDAPSSSPTELARAIVRIQENYSEYTEKAHAFARYHLHRFDGIGYIADLLIQLIEDPKKDLSEAFDILL
jgi:hypothetical protein